MAKKSRRARKRARRSTVSTKGRPADELTPAPQPPVQDQGTANLREYAYVIADLRQVTILALAVFALLIGLSFLVR